MGFQSVLAPEQAASSADAFGATGHQLVNANGIASQVAIDAAAAAAAAGIPLTTTLQRFLAEQQGSTASTAAAAAAAFAGNQLNMNMASHAVFGGVSGATPAFNSASSGSVAGSGSAGAAAGARLSSIPGMGQQGSVSV